MPDFVPGRELNAAFYAEVVAPAIGELRHAAAFIGWGSDVLGYDTVRSTDHGWGPRQQIFVADEDIDAVRARIVAALPDEFLGWPVRFGWDEVMQSDHIEVTTLWRWLRGRVGLDLQHGVATADWLALPQQLLLGIVGGPVFHDGVGDLTALRAQLAWYPDDVWLYVLACQWQRIGQEEHFVGRTAEVGDDLGSRILAARMGRDVMRLCFLIERQYTPYSKWLGTAFAQLPCASEVGPALARALAADAYPAREAGLVEAYEAAARAFNALGLVEAVDPTVRQFYTRPFLTLASERFAAACRTAIADRALRDRPLVGAIDQFVDSTDVLSHSDLSARLRDVFSD